MSGAPFPFIQSDGGPLPPPKARGTIGTAAAALGFATKDDENIRGTAAYWAAYGSNALRPMPGTADPSWTEDDVEQVRTLSERAASLGDVTVANLWRANLEKPRSSYCNLAALGRMVDAMARREAGRDRVLPPVEPSVQYRSLAEVLRRPTRPIEVLPEHVACLAVERLNELHRAIAAAGFASPRDVNLANAPREVVALSERTSRIHGALTRAINQLDYLVTGARLGQTAHAPMTFARRLLLADDALVQLAEEIGCEPWTAESLGMITDEVRRRWSEIDVAAPTPVPTRAELDRREAARQFALFE